MAEVEAAPPEELDRQLSMATKKSSRKLADDLKHTQSAYIVHETSEPDSFCSGTISWYNVYLRNFQTMVIILVVLCLYLNSYIFFFNSNQIYYNIGVSADIFYTFIMFLRSRTGHMIDGVEERNLLKVRERYQTSLGFILDFISMFPVTLFRWFSEGDEGIFFVVGRQKSYVRLYYVLYYLGIREEEPGSSTFIYRTLKYLLLSTLVIHFTACGWYGLACSRTTIEGFSLELCSGESWIVHLPIKILEKVSNANYTVRGAADQVSFLHDTYVTSLYWSSATTSSTGYGDIHAYTIPEKVYSVFAMLLGMAVLYGMTMGGMTSMLTNIDARRSSFVHRYTAFRTEVESMGVSKEVEDLCLRYFDYLWHRWEGEDVQESGVLSILPQSLQASFSEATFKQLIRKADLLKHTEDAFLRNLALSSKSMVYLENQFIQRSGEIASSMCFIHSGIVEVLDSDEEETIATMHEGKLFGQILLVFDLPRINSIRCRTNCDIFVLNKHDFKQVLSEYPEAAKQFVEAARMKCEEGGREWPMKAPSISDFNTYIEKANTRRRRMSIATGGEDMQGGFTTGKKLTSVMSGADLPTSTRRMTTVYSTEYEGIDLSRVIMHKQEKERQALAEALEDGAKPSLVDFVLTGRGARAPGKRSSTVLADGTELIAANAQLEDLKDAVKSPTAEYTDPDQTTMMERLAAATLVNPGGRLTQWWQMYIFILSLFTGIYTTFVFFFATTPGKETTYAGTDVESLPLLSIARESVEPGVREALRSCDASASLDATVECIINAGGVFATMITGNGTAGYQVTVPATYDVTYSGYNTETPEGQLQIFIAYIIVDLSYILNILLNFRTEVKTPNGLLTKFKDIKANYMKWNLFWMDLLSVFPFEILAPMFPVTRLAKYHAWIYLRFNRILNYLRYVPSTFTKWEYSLDVQIVRIRTIKFVVYIYTFTHVCSCLFYCWSCGYIMQSFQARYPTKCSYGSWAWVFDMGFDTSQFEDYIKTMYWASTTMTSTGYGDISASTTTGRLFALATMVIGTLMYGWLVAVIASTVSNSEAAIVSFTNAIQSTKQYLLVHSVPNCLVDRVLDCRLIEWHRYHGTATPGVETIGRELPEMLHAVMLYESVSKFVKEMPFFHDVDTSFIAMLCNHVHMYHYSEGDVVIYEGDLSRELYIIKQGHCDVVTQDMTEVVDHLRPGDYFGEIEILFGCGSPRTVVADTPCEVLVLTRESIDEVLRSFPILQTQMESIEQDDAYRNQVMDAIDRRKETSKTGIDMRKRFEIEQIIGGALVYGKPVVEEPLIRFPTEADKARQAEIYEEMNPLLRVFVKVFLMPFTFHPMSKPYIVYESIRVALIVTTLLLVPVQAAILPRSVPLLVIQYILDGLCLVDQYIKLHTNYYNEREVLVHHPARTAMNYLKTSFVLDLVSWFPIEIFAMAAVSGPWTLQQWKLFAILRFGRVLQGYKMLNYFWFWLDDVRYKRRWIKHMSSVLYGFIIHHWMACLLFIAACPPDASPDAEVYSDTTQWVPLNATGSDFYCQTQSWVGGIATQNVFPSLDIIQSVSHQYIVSIYWATATLVCVGYGDIHATMQAEMFMATVVMILGTVYYSSVLGDIAANIQTDDIQRGHYKGRLSDILKFFKVYEVTKETQRQVLNYYCYLWDRTQGVSPSYLLRGLPPSLRTSVCQSMYDDMIREAFGHAANEGSEADKKETEGFFRLMTTRIQPRLYLKQSVICRRGDVGEEMFFIQRGNVAIMEEDDETLAKVLGPGQHFGEVALLFASPRGRTITALTNCDLNVLSKKDLDDILDKFPKFRTQMTAIAQDRQLQGTKSESYVRQPSKADLTMDIVYDQDGRRNDGADRTKYAKVLDRESTMANVWNHITVALAFLSSCIVVYQAGYQSHSSTLYILGYLIDVWFALDMVISFHMSYLDQFSTNVDNRDKIRAYYGKNWTRFALDAVANLPLELAAHAVSVPGDQSRVYAAKLAWLSYLRLLRVLRMKKVLSICKSWEEDIRKDVLMVRMYKFMLSVCFTINSFACIWYFVACPSGRCGSQSWTTADVTNYGRNRVWGYHFLPFVDSWYWAVATMTSTGYGDIKPETPTEMLYSCFVMVCGKIMIGYVLGMVAATLANDESLRVWYEQRVSSVKMYMTDLKFGDELFQHVIQYYDYMWMKNQGVDVMQLFPDLSFSLRADIYNQICRDMINGLDLFKGCSENFLRHLCMVMHPTAYMPGDYICLQGDIRSELYVIHHGVAEAMKRDKNGNKIPLRLVQEGESFLCESVLAKVRRPCSLRARTYVDVFSMSMDDLQGVIKYHPDARLQIIENARRLYPTIEL